PRSAPAIPSSSANAGSDASKRANPGSRDSPMRNCASEVWPGACHRAALRADPLGPSRNDLLELLLQMLRQEAEATRPGDIRARLVVACPFVAVKAVLRARIDVYLDIGPLGADGLDIAQRDACILLAEMQLGRRLRLVVGEANDRAPVIADRCRKTGQLGGGGISDAAAKTKPDDPDRTEILDGIDRGLAIAQHCRPIGVGDELRATVTSSAE